MFIWSDVSDIVSQGEALKVLPNLEMVEDDRDDGSDDVGLEAQLRYERVPDGLTDVHGKEPGERKKNWKKHENEGKPQNEGNGIVQHQP